MLHDGARGREPYRIPALMIMVRFSFFCLGSCRLQIMDTAIAGRAISRKALYARR